LIDGNYQLTEDTASTTSMETSTPMAADFVFGDTEGDNFFTFFGDSDGDRDSDVVDYINFRTSYRTVSGDTDFDSNLDFENNGNVRLLDFLEFRTRFQSALPFTTQFNQAAFSAVVSPTDVAESPSAQRAGESKATRTVASADDSFTAVPFYDERKILHSTTPLTKSLSSQIPSVAPLQPSISAAAVENDRLIPLTPANEGSQLAAFPEPVPSANRSRLSTIPSQ
jgi:hypothetical protein